MSGEMMFGKCQCCGKERPLIRTYFHYPVKCECHSPNHFEIIDHCAECTPKEPTYTKVEFKTEDLKNPVAMAMKVVMEELSKDKTEGSWYYSWQSNIACIIMDNSEITHEKANEIAKKFLEHLIR